MDWLRSRLRCKVWLYLKSFEREGKQVTRSCLATPTLHSISGQHGAIGWRRLHPHRCMAAARVGTEAPRRGQSAIAGREASRHNNSPLLTGRRRGSRRPPANPARSCSNSGRCSGVRAHMPTHHRSRSTMKRLPSLCRPSYVDWPTPRNAPPFFAASAPSPVPAVAPSPPPAAASPVPAALQIQ
jgi:hypothetical protein